MYVVPSPQSPIYLGPEISPPKPIYRGPIPTMASLGTRNGPTSYHRSHPAPQFLGSQVHGLKQHTNWHINGL